MTQQARVGVFGGSFNPPHVGHVLAAAYLLSVQAVDLLLVIPVFRHPFAKQLAPYPDRLAMCQLAMEWLPSVEVSDIEGRLGGESRTLATIEALLQEEPNRALRLIIGADVLKDRESWHRFDQIAELAPPLILGRAGVDHPEAPAAVLPAVSSTQIRDLVAGGHIADCSALLPAAVHRYLVEHQLYGGARS
ncbi:MAG: nicotinate (nicotinamide) nucleotide adenylyltransferase [Deltaproteobacteria bacterium]|nr:MAG: nicotinate (nicotinamide) nucleotide adenylyltransferase [Deltaproteobacteria bacterium]